MRENLYYSRLRETVYRVVVGLFYFILFKPCNYQWPKPLGVKALINTGGCRQRRDEGFWYVGLLWHKYQRINSHPGSLRSNTKSDVRFKQPKYLFHTHLSPEVLFFNEIPAGFNTPNAPNYKQTVSHFDLSVESEYHWLLIVYFLSCILIDRGTFHRRVSLAVWGRELVDTQIGNATWSIEGTIAENVAVTWWKCSDVTRDWRLLITRCVWKLRFFFKSILSHTHALRY